MRLEVGKVSDENAVVDKAFTVELELDVVLEENVTVSDPTFIITMPASWSPSKVNYCYAPALGRYYYVNDIEVLQGPMLALHCHVDVLKSFAAGIRANTAIVDRKGEFGRFNKYINGSEYVTENRNKNQIIKFEDAEGGGFTQNPSYIFIVAGG